MDSLTIILTNTRLVDGYVQAANHAGMTPEDLALEFLAQQGARYADGFGIGVITSSAFMARFKSTEYAAILSASEPAENATEEESSASAELAALIAELTSNPTIKLDDLRLIGGLNKLAAVGLINETRIPELLAYSRPVPEISE